MIVSASRRHVTRMLAALMLLATFAGTAFGQPAFATTDTSVAEQKPGRSLGIASVPNLRDLGGYVTSDGRTVALGLVYRANQLNEISERDMEKLASLKLKTDFDLRTKEERDARPDELPEGVKYVWLDVLADADEAGPAKLEKLMSDPKTANEALMRLYVPDLDKFKTWTPPKAEIVKQ